MAMNIPKEKSGLGIDIPPLKVHVLIYFIQKRSTEKEANLFFQQQEQRNWTDLNCRPIKNWKTLACDWIWTIKCVKAKSAIYKTDQLHDKNRSA
jgi:hypothetical protein